MSVVYAVDVFCDRCSQWVTGVTGQRPNGLARRAREEARAAGWARNPKSMYPDLCPDCLKNTEPEVANDEFSGR